MQKKIVITRLQKKFSQLVKAYLKQEGLSQSQLAKMVGIQRTHLNALLNCSPKRKLSAYYLFQFIKKGVLRVEEICDGKANTEKEVEFWKQAKEAENLALLGKIARLREKGIDVQDLLERMYPDV